MQGSTTAKPHLRPHRDCPMCQRYALGSSLHKRFLDTLWPATLPWASYKRNHKLPWHSIAKGLISGRMSVRTKVAESTGFPLSSQTVIQASYSCVRRFMYLAHQILKARENPKRIRLQDLSWGVLNSWQVALKLFGGLPVDLWLRVKSRVSSGP